MNDSLSREEIRKHAESGINLAQLFMRDIEREPNIQYTDCKRVMESMCTILETIQNGTIIENLVEPSRRVRPRKKK